MLSKELQDNYIRILEEELIRQWDVPPIALAYAGANSGSTWKTSRTCCCKMQWQHDQKCALCHDA